MSEAKDFKEGDYTPLNGLPAPRQEQYVKDVLDPHMEALAVAQLQTRVDAERVKVTNEELADKGLLGKYEAYQGRKGYDAIDAQSEAIQDRLDAAKDNIREHASTAYPHLTAPQEGALEIAGFVNHKDGSGAIIKPTLTPESTDMSPSELKLFQTLQRNALQVAKGAALDGEPLIANVNDAQHEGTVTKARNVVLGK
jgi:hypothetical protein